MTLIGPSTSLRLFTIFAFGAVVVFVIGLKNLHFPEQNFYTTVVRKFEGLCEGQIKCEVVPPIKQGLDYHNEVPLHKATVMEKSERKKEGGKKDNIKKGKYFVEENKETLR